MAVKKTNSEHLSVPPESDNAAEQLGEVTNGVQAELQALAYQLWMDRGSPIGSPEIDWFEAEARIQLHARASARRRGEQRAAAGIGRAR